jgi:hypothetical protein
LEALYPNDIDAQIQSLLVSVKDMKLDDSRFKLSVMAVIASSSDVRNLAEKTRDIHVFLRTAEDVDLWNYSANTFKLLEVDSYDIFVDVFHALTVLPTRFNPYELQCYEKLKLKMTSLAYGNRNMTSIDIYETDMDDSSFKATPVFLNYLYHLSIFKNHYKRFNTYAGMTDEHDDLKSIIYDMRMAFRYKTYMGWNVAFEGWVQSLYRIVVDDTSRTSLCLSIADDISETAIEHRMHYYKYATFCDQMYYKIRTRAANKIYFWWIPICYDINRACGQRRMMRSVELAFEL